MTTRLFGIRHHGPGSARALSAELVAFQPDVVLIEGPPEADAVVRMAADPGLEPPVALLAYAVDDVARAAFWPFAVFSPEWQAIRHAVAAGVPVRFCDLPAAHQFALGGRPGGSGDPLARLAAVAGYDDPERWWDDMIEHRRGGEPAFDVIADAMAALRADEPTEEHDARREAYMRTVLRRTRKDGFERIAVVCGAWHVPALTDPLPPASRDQAVLRGLPKRKTACAWVPWTHGRLAASSGYGAGVTSPGWYHHLFTTDQDVTARWLTAVAGVLRAEDLPVSTAHVIEAVRLADTLAALRDRVSAGLAEVTEATLSVLCGGNEVQLDLVTRRLVVGERMGSVPDDAPLTPLAADLAATARRLRLKRDPLPRELDLDLRNPGGLERSRLLHRLRVIGIPWGRPAASARRSTGTFRETWELAWQPEFEVDLVAAGVHGTTVAGAAAARIRAAVADAPALADVTAAVERCLLADLPDALPDALAALDARAAGDADVAHLMAAFPALARATRYGDVRGTDTGALRTVAERVLARICAGLPPAAHGIDDDEATRLSGLVDGVHGVTGLLGDAATDRWLGALGRLAERPALPPLLAGRLARLLADTDRMAADEVERRLARALTAGTPAAHAGAYVEGFFAGGALLLVHDDRLLRIVDRWLAEVAAEQFDEVLPLLRRTFGAFADPERRAIGERAAALGGAVPAARAADGIDEQRAELVVPVFARLLGVGAHE
ncbi:hypothetical protein FHX44_118262 [Pseudonocardia hierapolitana]|uniref:Uncharacterized protein n=1 Tax=Pseudonocardia hierapolitana TaxID=1128676 RepID=A0A561T5C8_9PSEU|nr:DUF5682 family protein [Pseudonocardia hierapolitana]TWF82313.1 hypothetical protein FHX44_118262 [Pseudonocardia hierapolitana]